MKYTENEKCFLRAGVIWKVQGSRERSGWEKVKTSALPGPRLQVLFPNFSPFFQIPMKLSVWHVRRWIRDLGIVPLAGDRVDQGQVLIDLSIVKATEAHWKQCSLGARGFTWLLNVKGGDSILTQFGLALEMKDGKWKSSPDLSKT